MKIRYILDRKTKNSYRFAPDEEGVGQIGFATIYLRKQVCADLCIKPDKGFTIDLIPDGSGE